MFKSMKTGFLVLMFAQAAMAGQYVGSADSGIANGWPTQNSFYPSNVGVQVVLHLDRTHEDPRFVPPVVYGQVSFQVGVGEGQDGPTYYGTYKRIGDNLYFYFDGKKYPAARGARLFTNREGTTCLSITMSTSRPPVVLCQGLIGA